MSGKKSCFEIIRNGFEIVVDDDENAETKKIICNKCFQNVVTDKWYGDSYGEINDWKYYLCLVSCIVFSPILLFFYFPYNVSTSFIKF